MATYKRSNFIIDPKFQYRFSFFICSLVLVGSMFYPLTIYDLYQRLIAALPGSPQLEESRNVLIMWLSLSQLAMLGLVFVITIFVGHKIAGPMYKLKMYLNSMMAGEEYYKLNFRKGDNFHDVADSLNQFTEHLREQREQDFKEIEEVSAFLNNLALVIPDDKRPVLEEAQSKLAQIRSRNV